MNSFVCCTRARAKSVLRQTAGLIAEFIGLIDMLGVFKGCFTIVLFSHFLHLSVGLSYGTRFQFLNLSFFGHLILGCRAGTDSAYMEL